MLRLFALTGLALLAASGPTTAQRLDPELKTTGDLLAICAPEPGSNRVFQRLSYCEGFIAGTGFLYHALREAGTIQPWACAPGEPQAEEIREKFVSWAKANPTRLAGKPIDGFWQAMADAYPCPAAPAAKAAGTPAKRKS